ncbi:MAG: radical SAM/SPASM domain-containing protein [Candidatus Nitrospinota bacterium M3_3B_026]
MKDTLTTKDELVRKGIFDGGRARTGPYGLQVGITAYCNLSCVFCAPFSYRRPGGRRPSHKNLLKLDPGRFHGLVDDAAELDVEQISIVGVGEPFLHPDIMSFIRRVKERGIRLMVTTNGSLLSRRRVDEIVEGKLDIINVSLNAASAQTHAKVSGARGDGGFDTIMESLSRLHERKKGHGLEKPRLALRMVLTRLNVHEVESFVETAAKVGADELFFQNYVAPHFARDIALDPGEKKTAAETLARIEEKIAGYGIKSNLESVISRYTSENGGGEAKTYMGYVVDDRFHEKYPCYTGWTYAMALANGSVMPCCYCSSPMGNLYEKSFKEIWLGERYNAFRAAAIRLPGRRESPEGCACFNSCGAIPDNIRLIEGLGLNSAGGG